MIIVCVPTSETTSQQLGERPRQVPPQGISLLELQDIFPDEKSATEWFEGILWPKGRCCGHCGAMNTQKVKSGKPMPYWCPECRSYFSVRTGTTLQNSRLPLRKWAFAIYLYVTNLNLFLGGSTFGMGLYSVTRSTPIITACTETCKQVTETSKMGMVR